MATMWNETGPTVSRPVPSISRRASRLVGERALPAYMLEHQARRARRWDPIDARDGYIGLCVSENKLVWDLLAPRLRAPRDVSAPAVAYDDWVGSDALRGSVARFLSRTFVGRAVDPSHVMVLAGAGAILEALFYVLADTGDSVLVPTPSYAGFWLDLEGRDQLSIVPVHTRADDGFRLTTELLDSALAGAASPVRALLFTTPDNPLGRVYEPEEIDRVLEWCRSRRIHAVFDEIYALSVFGDRPFNSVATRRGRLGDSVHLVWGFSKDFAMSGLRCGVLVSENEDVIAGIRAQGMWATVSGDTQHLLAGLIADDTWVDGYLAEMPSRLRHAYALTASVLDEVGVDHLPSEAGFFLLADFRRYLHERSWEAEEDLWRRLLDHGNVNLTPGSACHIGEPGFMRLCFATEPAAAVEEAVRRIGRILEG